MQYSSPDVGHECFVDLGEFYSEDWGKDVDLYAIVRPDRQMENPWWKVKKATYTYISLGARFSDDEGDYHSVPVYVYDSPEADNGDVKRCKNSSIDGVRVAFERLVKLGIIKENIGAKV